MIKVRQDDGTRVRIQSDCGGPSKTQQHQKDLCDINRIVKSYTVSGEYTHLNKKQPIYGDFATVGSYQESADLVKKADETFMQLPSEIRSRFENDPGQLLDFLADPENLVEAVEIGLLERKEKVGPPTIPEPIPAVPTPPAPEPKAPETGGETPQA